jgi:TRAP-type C4-dicarboxylate transport system permease small subunit
MKKVIDWIANIYLFVALLAFFCMIAILTVEIISRYFFDHSFVWSQEMASILICWITFLGFGKIVVDREDISITYLVKKLSSKALKIVSILNSLLLFLISSIMLFYSYKLTISHLEKTTLIMKAASAWFYAPLVLLLFLVVLYSIYQLVMTLKFQLNLFTAEEGE